jgi:hypothetical protein
VPDTRSHRGPHSDDARLFAPAEWPRLQRATAELCWLLGRGYGNPSALKLVGDHHQLADRQRSAVGRCACSEASAARREERRVAGETLAARQLWIDGYNVLTTVEVALSGGVVLGACDATYRDLAGMHGTYRKVTETVPALELLGQTASAWGSASWVWFLDRPVGNSARLKAVMEEIAAERAWAWRIELVQSPDRILSESSEVIATADSAVLDRCHGWFNLAREVIDRKLPGANLVPLSGAIRQPFRP